MMKQELAPKYMQTQHPRFAEWIERFAHVALSGSGSVLDIGCGTKWYHQFLGGSHITSVDAWSGHHPDVVLDAGISPLPWAPREFDMVLMLDVLEHMKRRRAEFALREAQRVCGGCLMLLTPLSWSTNEENCVGEYAENPYNLHRSLWRLGDFLSIDGWERIYGIMDDSNYYLGVWRPFSGDCK
jgi:SAM-dependent methyltransferase